MSETRIAPRPLPSVLLTSELTPHDLNQALSTGALTRVRHGAYTKFAAELTSFESREQRALAEAVAVDRQLRRSPVFSHATAALIHGLWLPHPKQEVHVTLPNQHAGRREAGLQRHGGRLPAEEITTVNGLRVTDISRTIIDCARRMHPRDALAVVDSGLRALLTPSRGDRLRLDPRLANIRAELQDRLVAGGRQGRRQAHELITFGDPFAESPQESLLRWIAISRGLPPPVCQLALATSRGTFYGDVGWRSSRRLDNGQEVEFTLVAEYDGEIKYLPDSRHRTAGTEAASRAVLAEKRREDAIRDLPGTRVLRFDRHDLRDAETTFYRLHAAFPAELVSRLKSRPSLRPYSA